jgi:hypothetical protein
MSLLRSLIHLRCRFYKYASPTDFAAFVPRGQPEISQTHRVWRIAKRNHVLKGHRKTSSQFHRAFRLRSASARQVRHENLSFIATSHLRSWLISVVALRHFKAPSARHHCRNKTQTKFKVFADGHQRGGIFRSYSLGFFNFNFYKYVSPNGL